MNIYLSRFLKITFFLLLFFSRNFLSAQQVSSLVSLKMDSVVTVKDDKIITLLLKFENNTNDTIKGYIKLPKGNYINFLTQDNLTVKINPEKKAFIPVKFSLAKEVKENVINLDFSFLNTKDSQLLSQAKAKLIVPAKKGIRIFPISTNLTYKQIGDSIHYDVRVVNVGNLPDKTLITTLYKDYMGAIITESKKVSLLPYEEKIVRFSKYVDYELMKLERVMLTITAYTDDEKFVGNVPYTIYNVNSNRTYYNPNDIYSSNTLNNFSISARGTDLNNASLNIQAHNEFNLGYNEYAYNINAFLSSDLKNVSLSNAWVDYRRKGKGIRVGNISYGNIELPIHGRGGMIFNNIEERDNRIVLGLVEENYDPFGDINLNTLKRSASVFASTSFLIKENPLQSSIAYKRSTNTKDFAVASEYKWSTPNKWSHALKLGYGNVSSYGDENSKNSFSIAVNVSGMIGKRITFYSSNFYSSPYYTGSRKGVLNLNQRFSIKYNRFSFFVSGVLNKTNPKSIIERVNDVLESNKFLAARVESGLSLKLKKNIGFSIFPRLNYESSLGINNQEENQSIVFKSESVGSTLYFYSRSKEHQFLFNFFGGYYNIGDNSTSKVVLSATGNWTFKNIRLNAIVQKGSLELSDVLNGYTDIVNYNLSLLYRYSFFNKKVNTDLTGYFSYNENTGKSFNVILNSYYNIRQKLKLTASINLTHNDSDTNYSKYKYYQLGAQYNFPSKSTNPGERFGNLKVFVFYDYNTNGVFDEGDKIADDRFVNINDVSFITDSKGFLVYKRIPYGDYTISIPGQKWYVKDRVINVQSKNTTIAIPMQLTGVVRGALKIESRSNFEVDVVNNLFGIVLAFKDENGNEIEVKTNNRGQYVAYLPIGNYTFNIKEQSLQKNVYPEVYSHKVTVEAEKSIEFPIIKLLIKEKKVNIKRFGS